MEDVWKDFEAVKSKLSQNTVAHALQNIRQLLSRPPGAFDAHATMAALEHLVDTARENADTEILRYNAILRQTRGLAENPVLQRVLLKLLGSKEEIAIAKEIATKSYFPTPCCVVFERVFNTPFLGHSHTTCPLAVLMALFVLPAAVLGISPEIVELEKGVDV